MTLGLVHGAQVPFCMAQNWQKIGTVVPMTREEKCVIMVS